MKKEPTLKQVIKDFKYYLGEMEKLTKNCSPEQKEHLREVLASLLILLVGFKKGTHMGEMVIDFKNLQ